MIASSLATLPSFLIFFAAAAVVVAVFVVVYVTVTPWPEFALIREGNTAAAVSLSGALLGFALPVADVIRNTHDLADLAVWSVVACTVQLLVLVVARRLLPRLAEQIRAGSVAPALLFAALSIAVGLLNAACMES